MNTPDNVGKTKLMLGNSNTSFMSNADFLYSNVLTRFYGIKSGNNFVFFFNFNIHVYQKLTKWHVKEYWVCYLYLIYTNLSKPRWAFSSNSRTWDRRIPFFTSARKFDSELVI